LSQRIKDAENQVGKDTNEFTKPRAPAQFYSCVIKVGILTSGSMLTAPSRLSPVALQLAPQLQLRVQSGIYIRFPFKPCGSLIMLKFYNETDLSFTVSFHSKFDRENKVGSGSNKSQPRRVHL